MLVFEVSTPIAARREQVWRMLSDVMSWPRWNPTVTGIESLGPSGLRVGNRFRVAQPKLRPAVWEVASVDPPSGFAWTAKSPGMQMIADHVVSDTAPGRTDLTLRFVFKGWLGVLAGRILGRLVKDYLAKESEALRRAVENGVS